MKYLFRVCLTVTLVCAFTYSTFAGEMNCPNIDPPPPPPPPVTEPLASGGDATSNGVASSSYNGESSEGSGLTEATWLILQGVLNVI